MQGATKKDEIPDFGKIENRRSVLMGQAFASFIFFFKKNTLSGPYLSMFLKEPDFSKMNECGVVEKRNKNCVERDLA